MFIIYFTLFVYLCMLCVQAYMHMYVRETIGFTEIYSNCRDYLAMES